MPPLMALTPTDPSRAHRTPPRPAARSQPATGQSLKARLRPWETPKPWALARPENRTANPPKPNRRKNRRWAGGSGQRETRGLLLNESTQAAAPSPSGINELGRCRRQFSRGLAMAATMGSYSPKTMAKTPPLTPGTESWPDRAGNRCPRCTKTLFRLLTFQDSFQTLPILDDDAPLANLLDPALGLKGRQLAAQVSLVIPIWDARSFCLWPARSPFPRAQIQEGLGQAPFHRMEADLSSSCSVLSNRRLSSSSTLKACWVLAQQLLQGSRLQ